MEYNLIYKCRRCRETFTDLINFKEEGECLFFLSEDLKTFHGCIDEKGIGVADLIGSGEIIIDK